MKKYYTLWMLLFLLIFGYGVDEPEVLAAVQNEVNEPQIPNNGQYYWNDFMDTADIGHDYREVELEFFTKIMEQNAGQTVNNGMNTELDFYFGIFKNAELHSYLYSEDNYTNIVGEYEHRIIDGSSFDVSFKGRLFYLEDQFTTPSIKVLTNKSFGDNLVFYNNLQIYIWNSGLIGKRIENGVSYTINPQNIVQARLKTFFDTDITEGTFDFRMAYKNIINEQTNLILYGYYETDNVHLESIVQFWPIDPLAIEVNAIINTREAESNLVVIRGEYSFNDNWMIESEFRKELVQDGYRYVKSGFTFNL